MQQVFQTAIFHREPIVLGRQLLPLSLWHEMVLLCAESPYRGTGEDAKLDQLAFAVAVCSQTWEQLSAWFASAGLLKDSFKWGKGKRNADFPKAHEAFCAYLTEARLDPDHEVDPKHLPQRPQHPWPMLYAVALFPRLGESRAWNCPTSLAASYLSCVGEIGGTRTLKDEPYYARLAEQKAYQEAQRKKFEAAQKEEKP